MTITTRSAIYNVILTLDEVRGGAEQGENQMIIEAIDKLREALDVEYRGSIITEDMRSYDHF